FIDVVDFDCAVLCHVELMELAFVNNFDFEGVILCFDFNRDATWVGVLDSRENVTELIHVAGWCDASCVRGCTRFQQFPFPFSQRFFWTGPTLVSYHEPLSHGVSYNPG